MSNLTLTRLPVALSSESDLSGQSTYVSVDLVPSGSTTYQETWQWFNAGLRSSLQRAGFPQPNEVIEERRLPPEGWVIVAPGIMVRTGEYQERFASLDLASLRRRMSSALFAAFIRHLGTVTGRPDLDVEEISQIPEIR